MELISWILPQESSTQDDTQGNHIISWTPTPEEKEQLRQAWKQGIWSKEETEQLKQNILDYCDVSLKQLDSWQILLMLTQHIFRFFQ